MCKSCFGNKRFDDQVLKHHKYHARDKLVCLECVKASAMKEQTFHSEFRKSKVYCKCMCPIHQERCPLAPRFAGEKRWPGCDGVISAVDRKFLDELAPRSAWWSKAWGKKN